MNHLYPWGIWVLFGLAPTLSHAGWTPLKVNRRQAKQQLQPRKVAVVIGINHTQTRYWSPLLYAKRDAIRMANALRSIAQFDRIIMRTQKQRTTKAALLHTIQQLKEQIRSPLDTVFVYISSHGTVTNNPKSKRQERYIVTSDTNQNTAKTAINVKRLVLELKGLTSKRIVLMLATCYTGSPRSKSKTKLGQKGNFKVKMKPLQDKALQILSASGFAQAAFESGQLKSDVYTHFFLECLHKLKKNKKNISTIDVHSCATQPTTAYVKKHQQEVQVPRADSQRGSNRDIWLLTKNRRIHSVGYFWAGRKSQNVRFELRRHSHTKGQASDVHWANPGEYIGVRPGRYTVIVRNSIGWEVRRHIITIRYHRLTQIQSENLYTPWQQLRRLRAGRNFILPFGYILGTAILGAGCGFLANGVVNDEKRDLIVGGMSGGVGLVFLLVTGMVHLVTNAQEHRLQLEIQMNTGRGLPTSDLLIPMNTTPFHPLMP